jgi:hypothetical protein
LELRVSGIARRRTEQAGAPLSWTSERADTFFVCEASEEGSGLRAPASASEASNLHGVGGGVLSSASDNNGGKFHRAQDRAPLSWTNERADTFFVWE